MGLTGHLSNPPEPLANLLAFLQVIHEMPKKPKDARKQFSRLRYPPSAEK